MTLEEFKTLRVLEGHRVHMVFSGGQQVVATLISVSTDLDGTQHLIYDRAEASSAPRSPAG
jgi:hypothetical protein